MGKDIFSDLKEFLKALLANIFHFNVGFFEVLVIYLILESTSNKAFKIFINILKLF